MNTDTQAPPAIASRSSWMVLAALVGGLILGALAQSLGDGPREPMLRIANAVGGLWLDGLKMTVIPLIVALLITGISSGSDSARAGAVAGRSFLWFFAVLTISAIVGGLAMPALIEAFPLPKESADALRTGLASIDRGAAAASVPKLEDFVSDLLPSNPFAAAAGDKILSLVLFTALFAFALTKVRADLRKSVVHFFRAAEGALLVLIGWILWLAPYGVFALAFAVGAGAGGAVFGALVHYIVLVSAIGWIMTGAGVVIAWFAAGWSPARFFREMIPPLAVAVSTQSSLASLPAMLASSRRLGVTEETSDVTLPLAVALFRATGPAMNIAVAIYVAYWLDVPLPPLALVAGIAVASIASYWAVSLPGSLSFITSIAPIALAMGVPIEPLAILIAVEVLPDITRTLGNVVNDVAVTGAVDRKAKSPPSS
ncbi:MAG: dicarboxylate/amino acid:cation symporter [Sphingomicrobium sp.]